MKKVFIILALIYVCRAQLSEEELSQPAHNWEIMKKINSDPSSTFKTGINEKFKGATLEDVVKLLGAKLTSEKELEEALPTMYHEVGDTPQSYDSRDAFSLCKSISHIQDQSACGSCWANASAAVMSDRICIHSDGQKKQTVVSTADLMSCCHLCGNGCNGGTMYQSFLFWDYHGIVTGGDYEDNTTCKPYPFPKCEHHSEGQYEPCPKKEYRTPACVRKCQKDYSVEYKDDKSHGTAYKISRKEEQIRAEIIKNGPVVAGFTVFEDFVAYKSGVYKHTTGKALGGHAVRIIGFGEEEDSTGNKIPYWLIANSWNETWGDKGLFKMIRGQDDCGIEAEIVAGLPKASSELSFLK